MKDFLSIFKNIVVPVKAKKEDGAQYWREKTLYAFSLTAIYAGFVVLIPSVIASIKTDLLVVAIMDIAIYILLVFFLSLRKFPYNVRVKSVFVISYILGIALLIILGPHGAGFIWLFSFPLLAGILEGLRSSIYASIINGATIIVLGIFVYLNLFSGTYFSDFHLDGWIAVGINFVGLNAFVAISLGILLNGLEESIRKENIAKKQLKLERDLMLRLKEKAEESDKLKTAFLTNVSHDIRTPMNSIIGFSDLLMIKKYDEEKQKKYLEIIRRQGGVLINLINDIIDIAKIEANEISFEYNQVNLNSYMDGIFKDFRLQLDNQNNKEVELKLKKGQPNGESNFAIDANRLRQILNNLISNALKFTHEGSVLFGYELKNSTLFFFVKDTGAGIPDRYLSIIFDRFRQVDNTLKNKHGGTGIGLSICKSLVELQGGKIWVESKLEKGSKFYFTLPLKY